MKNCNPLTVSALSRELGINRRSLRRILETVPPVAHDRRNGWPLWALSDVKRAITARERSLGPVRTLQAAKLAEEARKLRRLNDVAEAALVPRSVVANAAGACCADWNAQRVRFEQEWPDRFQGKAIPECRELVRQMMTEIGGVLKNMAAHFSEPAKGGADVGS